MKVGLQLRVDVIRNLLRGKVTIKQVEEKLQVSKRTVKRYKQVFLKLGPEGLKDHHHSNNCLLTQKEKKK